MEDVVSNISNFFGVSNDTVAQVFASIIGSVASLIAAIAALLAARSAAKSVNEIKESRLQERRPYFDITVVGAAVKYSFDTNDGLTKPQGHTSEVVTIRAVNVGAASSIHTMMEIYELPFSSREQMDTLGMMLEDQSANLYIGVNKISQTQFETKTSLSKNLNWNIGNKHFGMCEHNRSIEFDLSKHLAIVAEKFLFGDFLKDPMKNLDKKGDSREPMFLMKLSYNSTLGEVFKTHLMFSFKGNPRAFLTQDKVSPNVIVKLGDVMLV